MALFINFGEEEDDQYFEWHVGEKLPFAEMSYSFLMRTTSIRADGHEKEYLYKNPGMRNLIFEKDHRTCESRCKEAALILLGMMMAENKGIL